MKTADLLARYDGRVPRYTSYPTAPHFSGAVGAQTYEGWLDGLDPTAPLSLYIHVPFCDRLCLYCGCNTSVVRQEAPKRDYAQLLGREISMLADRLGGRAQVSHVHWGGGTPTSLPNDCLTSIMDLIRKRFILRTDAEIAIEIDPTSFTADKCDAIILMGVNRASLGVQDFDPAVQAAIGRMQSFEQTAACADLLRGGGISALNLDLIYGLPLQTIASVTRTAQQALALAAGRIAVFGYAHVPWMKRHQALIAEASLPDTLARFAQLNAIAHVLSQAGGYVPVGLDHYARPDDALAVALQEKSLHRCFQGYTTDAAPALIGIGASSIGSLPQGYAQNETRVPAYAAAINAGKFAIARGVVLTSDDKLRRAVIEKIMCDLDVDLIAMAASFGANPAGLLHDAARLVMFQQDGLVQWNGRRLQVTPAGRPFVRNVAALFDAYLRMDEAAPRHAQAV
ncbi:MAG: oxygen-independent coproporphyrinogen III oxidase [Acidocella sp. 20-57-95]|nr:MAG: oxygen-independent coproporphyrinogen III oxidase [Acidocella sp. 20-57-95]OYV59789.1 MAG: oxygen-independent coproporphyrinogen III oxidase [Acidocella sp. 21-58-7]HQT63995.1 oxygen-independent coproporphyrinogen III oxidase [Acidocella sp.]HQU03362.1 oxygen-independent coproporphyrinogen III oxidase [Acidocella sp.]